MIRVVITGILSLLFPGIGQIFNNQWLKGLGLVIVELGLIYFVVPNVWITILFRLIWLYAIIDAVVVAYRAHKNQLKSKGLTGTKMITGVVATMIILPLAWLPSFLPDIMFHLAAKSDEIVEENVPEGQFDDESEEYQAYLEDKFDEKFTLGEGTYNERYEHYIIDAHPEGEEEILFIVHQDEDDEYQDTYVRNLWTDEANAHFESFIHDIYENVWEYDLDVMFKSGDEQVILDESDGILPPFLEGIEIHPDHYDYSLQLYVIRDMDDRNKMDEFERMYELISKLKDEEIAADHFEIKYYDEKLLSEIDKDTERDILEHNDYASFFLSIGPNEFEDIASGEDLEEYIVDLRE